LIVVYEKEVDTHINIIQVNVENRYDNASSTSAALDTLKAAYDGTNGVWTPGADLHHALLGRGLNGGIAYLSVICNSLYGFGVSAGITGSYGGPGSPLVWDLVVFMHELGRESCCVLFLLADVWCTVHSHLSHALHLYNFLTFYFSVAFLLYTQITLVPATLMTVIITPPQSIIVLPTALECQMQVLQQSCPTATLALEEVSTIHVICAKPPEIILAHAIKKISYLYFSFVQSATLLTLWEETV